jgi:hypothetical protein
MESRARFEWDQDKDEINREKHGVSFAFARRAFEDPDRVIVDDAAHSGTERRYFCLGMVRGKVLTVRFTYRRGVIRIIGAGYWRKGRERYDQTNRRGHL